MMRIKINCALFEVWSFLCLPQRAQSSGGVGVKEQFMLEIFVVIRPLIICSSSWVSVPLSSEKLRKLFSFVIELPAKEKFAI